jgi:hypothetical protein
VQDAAGFYDEQEGTPARFQRLMERVTAMRTSKPQLKQTGSTLRLELRLAATPDDASRFHSVRDWLAKLTTEPGGAVGTGRTAEAPTDPEEDPTAWRR